MTNKVTLTRQQIERLATFLALTENIESVTIEQTHENGIGIVHRAMYHSSKIERDWKEDITDVEDW